MSGYGSALASGKIPGRRSQLKTFVSENVSTTKLDLWEGLAYTPDPWPNLVYNLVPRKIKIKSTSDQDKPGGTGLSTISIDGVGDGYSRKTENTIVLNGTTEVETEFEYLGLNSANGGLANVLGGKSVGDITFYSDVDDTLQGVMLAGTDAMFSSHFFVPNNERCLIHAISFTGEKNAEYNIEFVGTFSTILGTISEGTTIPIIFFESGYTREFKIPFPVPPASRIRVVAKSDQGSTNVLSGNMELEFVDNFVA